jgi:hypothetical protein
MLDISMDEHASTYIYPFSKQSKIYMDEHGNVPYTHSRNCCGRGIFVHPEGQKQATVSASTFSFPEKERKIPDFISCSTCPEAPATMSCPGSFFSNRKYGDPARRVSRSNQIKISASTRAPGMATLHEGGRRAGRPWPQVSPASPPPQARVARQLTDCSGVACSRGRLICATRRPLDLPSSTTARVGSSRRALSSSSSVRPGIGL